MRATADNVIALPTAAPVAAVPAATPEVAARAAAAAALIYGDTPLGTGESTLAHAAAVAGLLASMQVDPAALAAAWLFALPQFRRDWQEAVAAEYGGEVSGLLEGLARLHKLRDVTRAASAAASDSAQTETLRKMLLAMVTDVRVVLIRLASRVQSLRHVAGLAEHPQRLAMARETLDFYAPLANRLGVWQLKWELEDLAFRVIEPDTYRNIAGMLATRRGEREGYIESAIVALAGELAQAGIAAQVLGRPKHIYSIWQKMRNKSLSFENLYDVRALRVLVADVQDCYGALGVVHNLWLPIPKEFDDYISRPKGNAYRSLHTAVIGPDDLAIEVQIRTHEMHRHAELGVAAHWRYKEAGVRGTAQAPRSAGKFDDKVAYLRQLLAWRDDVAARAGGAAAPDWRAATARAKLDDAIYVMTPQGRVIDLPPGATPVDFAYSLHTDLGHRCRGARVDGALVPLNTPLATGQQVEITTSKVGGPSRDWLNAELGYIASHRARAKVRQWFSAQDLATTTASGRAVIERELQRLGRTGENLEQLAAKLGFAAPDELFTAAARGEWSLRNIAALFETPEPAGPAPELDLRKSRITPSAGKGILIVGVDRLMTQLARCCKPAPPDAIGGFITRGKGVSIHRVNCPDYRNLMSRNPERVIETRWGAAQEGLFAIDVEVEAQDRPGLLRDIGEVFSREKANVTASRTASRRQAARMAFTIEVASLASLERTLAALREVPAVYAARRASSAR